MTAAAVLAVRRADHDLTCRRCGQPIEHGRRVVLLAGAGNVHIRCVADPGQNVGDHERTVHTGR